MSSRDDRVSPAAPRRRWIRGALIGSIALNLFLIAVVAVWAVKPLWREHAGGPAAGAGGEHLAQRMASRLPEVDRPILRQAMEKRESAIRGHMRNARAAQQDARRSLAADPFDPDAFSAASDRVRAARDAAQAVTHQALREAAVAMSHEGRMRLAQPPRGSRADGRGGPPAN